MELTGDGVVTATVTTREARESCWSETVPRVCFLGDGVSGSYVMRAEQIASTRSEWTAMRTERFRSGVLDAYDVFVIVKRYRRQLAELLQEHGKLVVYDVVDPWLQPDEGLEHDTLPRAIAFFSDLLRGQAVDGVIFPNEAMLGDYAHLVSNPIRLYHHFRAESRPIEVRREVRTLGYEGRADYLGDFEPMLRRLCDRFGLELVLNPDCLSRIDVGFAGRSGPHGSLIARRYKSNVKLANLFGCGIPAIAHRRESSYRETDNGDVEFFSTEDELAGCLERLLPYERRLAIHRRFLEYARSFSLAAIADEYETYFLALLADAAAGDARRRAVAA